MCPEPYPFKETLAQLDEIDQWLRGHGYNSHHRIRKYRKNIREMVRVQATDSIEALERIPETKKREIFWSYVEADEFVRAVGPLRDILGNELPPVPIHRALDGPADLYTENQRNSQGRNFMFELVMGGRLARAKIVPAFDQGPDLQFNFRNLRVAMQCKRPFSRNGLEETIGKAISQLHTDGADLNIIAVSISRLWNAGDPLESPVVQDPRFGQAYLDEKAREIADISRRFWKEKLERAAIFFYGFAPIRWLMENGSYGFAALRTETLCPVMTADVETRALLANFAHALGA